MSLWHIFVGCVWPHRQWKIISIFVTTRAKSTKRRILQNIWKRRSNNFEQLFYIDTNHWGRNLQTRTLSSCELVVLDAPSRKKIPSHTPWVVGSEFSFWICEWNPYQNYSKEILEQDFPVMPFGSQVSVGWNLSTATIKYLPEDFT